MSKLPKQIQLQVDQADAFLAAAATPAQAPELAAPVDTAPEPVEPPVSEPAAREQAPAPTPAPPGEPEEKWEARYKTLQGMHNRNMADMKERLNAIEQQNQQMVAQLNAAKAAPAPAPSPDPQHAEVFGQDLVDMVQSVAEKMFGAAAQKFEARLSAIEQTASGTSKAVAQTAEEIFLARLKEAVPDYAAINADEGFLTWLGEEDDVYGVPRQSALTAASNALDVARTAKVFLAYKALVTPAAPPPQAPPARTSASQLERQIAPNTVAPTPTRQAQPQMFRVADVEAFYADMRMGKYRGREVEAQQIEAQINAALAEGRIA